MSAASSRSFSRAVRHLQTVTGETSVPDPFRYAERVEVDAPLDALWAYAGNSLLATDWSVYFHHISPLPESPVPDGQIGSLRRCYRREDETGPTWDEEVTALVPKRYREIRTYALRNFRWVGLAARQTEYRVGQHYESLGPERSRLTFSTELIRPRSVLAKGAFALFARETVRIFRVNLENIAAAVEADYRGEPYRRPHPYEPSHPLD